MSFWSTLVALFVRDTVKDYHNAKKQAKAEYEKSKNTVPEWERRDNERFIKYAPLCNKPLMNLETCFNTIIENEYDSIDYSIDKRKDMIKAICAYPFYAVLCEQGGGVDEVQKRYLATLHGTETMYSGNDILFAAKNQESTIAQDIRKNAALSYKQFGKAWAELLSIPSIDEECLKAEIKSMVEDVAIIAENFALMADIIVEQLLKDEILETYQDEENKRREKIWPKHTKEQWMLSARKHAEKLYAGIENYCSLTGIDSETLRSYAEYSLMGIAYKNVKYFEDQISDPCLALGQLKILADLSNFEITINWFTIFNSNPNLLPIISAYPGSENKGFWDCIWLSKDREGDPDYMNALETIFVEFHGVLWAWSAGIGNDFNVKGFSEHVSNDFLHNVERYMFSNIGE